MVKLNRKGEQQYQIEWNGQVVGWVELLLSSHATSTESAFPQLRCYVSPDFRGKGYAVQACNLLMEQAEEADVSLLFACCETENASALRLLQRLGFELKRIRGDTLYFEAKL